MNPELWKEVERIYTSALDRPADQREAFARAESRGNEEILAEVLRLLRADAPPAGFMESPDSDDSGPHAGLPRRLGDFDLLEEIGRGAMGVVYRAVQRPLGRVVAVKVLPPGLGLSQHKIDRFLREARAAAKLHHPNIVPVITVDEDQGVRFFAMEYIEGHNLAVELKYLRGALKEGKVRPSHLPDSRSHEYFRSVARMTLEVADAIQHAHENGVIHRDIKPSNLQLDMQGGVHVVDFGLARDEGQKTLTKTGDQAGTPRYMSPEQARSLRHQIDHRTDVYSLGVVLYELLTLKVPFDGETSNEIIDNILKTEATRIRRLNKRVPRDLELICNTAMAKEVSDRYATAGDLRDDLRRFLSYEAIRARPPSPMRVATRAARRHSRAIGAVMIAGIALACGWWWSALRAEQELLEEHLHAIAEAREEGPLRALPLSRQLDLRRRLQELNVEGAIRAAQALDPVSELEQGFAEYHDELRSEGLGQLARARDPSLPEGARESSRLSGLLTLMRAAQLFPEDEELRELASVESAFPTITVQAVGPDGSPIPAQIWLRTIDPMTTEVGPRRKLGRAPLGLTPVEPGYYRVLVVFEDGGFRELACNPGPAFMEIELTATRREDENPAPTGMITYAETDFTFADFPGEPSFQGSTVHLDAFLLDEAEVSNAEYYEFVRATGARLPTYWKFVEDMDAFLVDHGDGPATSMSWNEARAYAEWRGKRLPTLAEWHRAAGGLDHWPLPNSPDPTQVSGNVFGPQPLGPGEQRWAVYLSNAKPVRSFPEARTPEGVYHMYGNVAEWTESMAISLASSDHLVPLAFERFYAGHAWDARERGQSMLTPAFFGIGPNYAYVDRGFRCAKSVAP